MTASAVQQPPRFFPRSHSTPDLSLGTPTKSNQDGDWSSWSETAFEVPSFNSDFELDTSLLSNCQPLTRPHEDQGALNSPRKPLLARSKAASFLDRQRSWLLSTSRPAKDAADNERHDAADNGGDSRRDVAHARLSERGTTQPSSGSLANFASKWSWSTTSLSSLKATSESSGSKPLLRAATTRHAKTSPKSSQPVTDAPKAKSAEQSRTGTDSPTPPLGPLARSGSYLSKVRQKPPALVSRVNDGSLDSDMSCASSSTSLANRGSSDKTSTTQSMCSDGNTNTPMTDEYSNDTMPSTIALRDPLWSSFKNLDVDFKNFGSKQTSSRISQVKNTLVPFLRNTGDSNFTKRLSLEDIERRSTILNKWWGAILDMLQDRGQHPVPGIERPVLLEAATLLMMRTEWRHATSHFQPLVDRSPNERVQAKCQSKDFHSIQDAAHDTLLADSAEHNVRTMFVMNLVKQMAYVVDRMSVRHAPLSLVNFSGKACAYAFFFAPGVADILVRLWGLTPELIRRAAEAFGLPRVDSGESDDIAALFPSNLAAFGWTSSRTIWDLLKKVPKMSLLIARIPWTGPWVSRWKGRDTDLFFIFCKYFHVLANQFIPQGLPMLEKARSPAFVVLHAQLLSILDTTIHRQMAMEHGCAPPPLIDSVNGADASALALPLPPTNLMKGMAENRLVVLLKDLLSDDAAEMLGARHTFAEAFACLLKGATCKTSQFNSTACFTLCDFVEEAINVYQEFETEDASTRYVDWEFWVDVCKRIMQSLNTMSEVRTLSFIYAIWDSVARDPQRKGTLCLDWLLTEQTFNALFNHWCPMVRAYYQRLLCWRICREDGSGSELDLEIMMVASARLRTAWSHYLYLKRSAEEAGRAGPSTVPTCPALGKRFMIIRHEVNAPQPGLFMGFDSFARITSSDGLLVNSLCDGSQHAKGDSKKRWSLFGKVLSMAGSNTGGTGTSSPGLDMAARGHFTEYDLVGSRRGTLELLTRPASFAAQSGTTNANVRNTTSESDVLGLSPVFDERKYAFKFVLGWLQQPMSATGRDLTRPRLPAAAHSQVVARGVRRSSYVSQPRGKLAKEEVKEPAEKERRGSVNATVEEWLRGTSLATMHSGEGKTKSNPERRRSSVSAEAPVRPQMAPWRGSQDTNRDLLVKAVKPQGIYASNCVYLGRALAEWALVVSECNNFVDRRCEEGVARPNEVEVPHLGVEGFRKLGA
ncbi:hypothetical protein CDD81_7788 [Ophiocordyceps australis]|uniref:Uncharacterized protein n=1 Tax=Ophiocordyceps australis TaxID=1399860 RepID=A0A2C5Y374_9HYPO|nr:hypothetical protein CDD81_7788 [Ophiocordyceps australis]